MSKLIYRTHLKQLLYHERKEISKGGKVRIRHGDEKPIKIEVEMKSEVGLFQVEEVLIPKIQSSPAKHLIELYARVEGEDVKRYL